ncbi:MAG: rRNA maturation RNAse YbeY, partial [Candidatus Marithrix sp.]|nr:rRNA maturation RNAse YbeY [Candidatus Marithrix sp.]
HGTMHLLGYDHISEQQAQIMESIEIKILHNLGYPNPYHLIDHQE